MTSPIRTQRRYEYEHLPPRTHIRILVLHAGNYEDPLQASIEYRQLSDPGVYEAISYAWGTMSASESIEVADRLLVVTDSLYQALLNFRKVDERRAIWADQVCINQKDDWEKSEQVGIMRSIYSKAERVLIWLGGEDEHAISVLSGARDWQFDMSDNNRRTTGVSNKLFNSVYELFGRPWFCRLWVIQEVAFARARIFCCGPYEVDFDHFVEFIRYNRFSWEQVQGRLNTTFHGLALVQAISPHVRKAPRDMLPRQTNLEDLLFTFADKGVSLPSDRIYALLSLATDATTLDILIDYSIPSTKVYITVTRAIIREYGSLALLWQIDPGKRVASYLPSWVPYYGLDGSYRNTFALRRHHHLSASGSSRASITRGDDAILKLEGLRIGIIEAVSKESMETAECLEPEKTSAWLNTMQWSVRGDTGGDNAIWKDFRDNTCTTVICSHPEVYKFSSIEKCEEFHRLYPPTGEDLLAVFKRVSRYDEDWGWGGGRYPTKEWKKSEFQHGYALPQTQDAMIAVKDRQLCITDSGFLGACYSTCEPGDEIWILMGSAIPVVLHPESRGGMHTFRGAAFIHGAMFGELLLQLGGLNHEEPLETEQREWLESLKDKPYPFDTTEILIV